MSRRPTTTVAEKVAVEEKSAELARPRMDSALTSSPSTAVSTSISRDSPGELANPPTPTESPHFEQLIIAMFLALAIAIVVGSMMFSLHKARWVSLEKEIKAARYELTRARTSLATILEMVEERLALTEQQRTPAVLDSSVPPAPQLAAAAPVAEASAEISIFKAQRPRPVQ